MTVHILHGDCRDVLKTLADASVHCCVTSPPYFGLRDYGVEGQIGLEQSPDAFVAELVAVFREVRRVLRDDGTLWLNLGDSYAGSWGARGRGPDTNAAELALEQKHGTEAPGRNGFSSLGIKPKDLMLIPARVALALQADGWWVRNDIVWAKPNPMPESIKDRCTKSHEFVFLLSKAERYYFDAEAIAEEAVSEAPAGNGFAGRQGGARGLPMSGGEGTQEPWSPGAKRKDRVRHAGAPIQRGFADAKRHVWPHATRNRRSVWTIQTRPFAEAHFATMPPELAELCILAGCPQGGVVLDPFGGAGTTGLVADRLQRDAVLIELNPAYAEIAQRRITGDAQLFAEVAA